MTVLNFPATPALNDTYTENGVTYTWNGNYWQANSGSALDDFYVKIAGDSMTGNLLLPGGGGNTAALQKQEIDALITAGDHWDRSAGALKPKVSTDNVDIGGGKITLNATDGTAAFQNTITIDNPYGESRGILLYTDGADRASINIYDNSTSSKSSFAILNVGNKNFEITNKGTVVGPSGIYRINPDGSAIFKGTVQTAGGVVTPSMVIELEADDDTKYTSTTDVDEEGNETVTRVYNGAVLDVKDRLQNVLARMDAIEANEITDDATDSALLTLIANLSARLDERDAQIAALTARVTTLES